MDGAFLTSPISAVFLGVSLLVIVLAVRKELRLSKKAESEEGV